MPTRSGKNTPATDRDKAFAKFVLIVAGRSNRAMITKSYEKINTKKGNINIDLQKEFNPQKEFDLQKDFDPQKNDSHKKLDPQKEFNRQTLLL